jgi:predicted dehydrogenase
VIALSKPLRIGILSTAKIARAFIGGMRPSEKVRVTKVASRDPGRGETFAKELGLDGYAGSYEDLLADPDIDAIYNPLPNSLHGKWSIQAARAGKHVLCEKPLSATAEEAREMIKAAQEAGVCLVEAYPYRSQPLTIRMQSMLKAGAIGTVSFVRADFGFLLRDESNIRMNSTLKGGALWDAGCYPVSLVTMIAGEPPRRVHAAPVWAATGVDKAMAATLEFNSGLIAQISCSFSTAPYRHAILAGSAGIICTEYLNHTLPPHSAALQIKRGDSWDAVPEIVEAPAANGFFAEAESFADMIANGPDHWNGVSNQESVHIMLTLDAIYHSAQSGRPVDLPA